MKIFTKFLMILLVAVVIALPVFALTPATPSYADRPTDKIPNGVKEKTPPGWERVDQNTTRHQLREFTQKGNGKDKADEKFIEYEIEISSLPATLPDNKTLIDTQWYLLSDDSGQTWYESGVNLFTARVQDGRVSVEDADGRLAVWDSRVMLGGVSFSGGEAEIVDDPLGNPNYENNALAWEYGEYATGAKTHATITRYLRTIEGFISELWYLPEKPNSGILIDIERSEEPDYKGDAEWLTLWDSEGRTIPIRVNPLGMFVIDVEDLENLVYPVWIDPTFDFTTTSSDGFMYNYNVGYAACRTAAVADYATHNTPSLNIGQALSYGEYYVARTGIYFYTASITPTLVVTASALYLAGIASADKSDTDFWVQLQTGMPTYPHDPIVAADFNYTQYTGNGGAVYTGTWASGYYNILELNSTGISWINRSGYTKFLLRSNREYVGTTPTGNEYVGIQSVEYGAGFAPQLRIVGYEPVTVPTVTTQSVISHNTNSGTMRGYLSYDGGEACSTRFQYDTSTAYSQATMWQPGYTTYDSFSVLLTGLTPGTLYYYRAQASNSAGTGTGTGDVFLTNPNPPYNATLEEGDTQITLAWTKGTGADTTMVRSSTTTYPATPTDGTLVYSGAGVGVVDNGLVNGTTYYYSIWSVAAEGGETEYSLTKVIAYGTPEAPAVAVVVTNPATGVGVTTAYINASLTDLGGYASADVSFQWGLTAAYGNTTVPVTMGLGTLSEGLAGLPPATEHHFRARAQNASGWVYGIDRTFTTGSTSAPTMTTNAATGIQLLSAQLNGTVTSDGTNPPVEVYFEWGLTTEYGEVTPTASGLSTGSTFYYGLSGLEPDTTYHFRSVGTNGDGIAYGADASFTTDAPTAPTVETLEVIDVGANQARLRGTVLTDGGVDVEVSFEYGTTVAYGENTAWVSGYSSGQSFDALAAGLTLGTLYHYRALVRNATDTGVGADAEFTTVFTAPTAFFATATSYATIQLGWTKQGDQTYIKYKTSGYPVDREDGEFVYFGPDDSTTLSGLSAGTTYYFRAWSWAEGDIWASTTATTLATTFATVVSGEEDEVPEAMLDIPPPPDSWDAEPSGLKLVNMPGYDALESIREDYELPESTFYFVLAMLLTACASLIVLATSKKVVAGLGAGILVMGLCSWLGMISGYMIIIYGVLAVGVVYFLSKRGATA